MSATTSTDRGPAAGDPLRPRVWAPDAERMTITVDGRAEAMERQGDWFVSPVTLTHGQRYAVAPDGSTPVPDPRSVWLPDGVHEATAAYDHARFRWTDDGWVGRDLVDAVIYELHVGTFTPEGTFDGVIDRLAHLRSLGVTHVELMPVCAFDGTRGWGYDGVAPWSVTSAYGGPDGLKRLVDAAHSHGLAVVLDVVHNHWGPSGNYLGRFGPYVTDAHHTPWGPAVNLDQPGSDEIVDYLIGSAMAWLTDFHVDGLRLDAVHELHDHRAVTMLEALSAEVDALRDRTGRAVHLIAESDRNDPRTVVPRAAMGMGMDGQWDDDVHHSLHTWLTGEADGYYADFAVDPVRALGRTTEVGFFHAQTYSSFRGRTHGRPADGAQVPAWRLVASLQTHDQVGNRAVGDRLSATLDTDTLACAAAVLLSLPFTPMLFMGEEWGAGTPWQFFSSFGDPDLARAVSTGRRREFAEHGWGAAEVPDPQDPATFARSVLRWDESGQPGHAQLLGWYRELLAWRAETRTAGHRPRLGDVEVSAHAGTDVLLVRSPWWCTAVNRGPQPCSVLADVVSATLSYGGATLEQAPSGNGAATLTLPPGSCLVGPRRTDAEPAQPAG